MSDLLSLNIPELGALLKEHGQPAFRAKQLFGWLHKGADYGQMSNLPAALRDELATLGPANPVRIDETRVSKLDGTEKYLYELTDGNVIEGVLMHYHYGYTLCVSTQVGCRMGCKFCASTLEGCVRSLTAGEMLGQIIAANNRLANTDPSERVSNVVLMGSGEPLDNYDNVVRFLRLMNDEQGLHMSLRGVSLSTCGLTDKLRKFAREGLKVTLSISLHAPNDEVRRKLMPVANTYPIADVIAACRDYIEQTGRRVIVEYALVKDVNCEVAHAAELASLLRGMQCHVNLIPLNTVAERDLYAPDAREIESFTRELERRHISVSRRREMGDDIQGACGQLRRSVLASREAEQLD